MYSWLATPSQTRSVLDRFGLLAKHSLGQNFLVNDDIIGKILSLSAINENDSVLEVGPGIGTLTCAMLTSAAKVVSIEADRDLPQVLSETLAQDSEKFALIVKDALKVAPFEIYEALEDLTVAGPDVPTAFVANLPYQVAATLILKYLQMLPSLERICVMVQAEVADRIAAVPGTKSYGAYTAKLHLLGEVTGRFEVGPHNFMPEPHVNSAVVRIDRKPFVDEEGNELFDEEIAYTSKVIDAAFALRRKTIRNSMAKNGFAKEALDQAFDQVRIDPGIRAETLDTATFVQLARALSEAEGQY